jgi:hypothetical protein
VFDSSRTKILKINISSELHFNVLNPTHEEFL